MRKANNNEIVIFKKKYCKSDETRIQIRQDFEVIVESHEEVVPGSFVTSFATGERKIEDEFVLFTVKDRENEVEYHPIFSVETARTMLNAWGIKMPPKRSILQEVNVGGRGGSSGGVHTKHNDNNKKLRRLILFARYFMVHHVREPEPMYGPFKTIYDKLLKHPDWDVRSKDILEVNDKLKKYINGSTNQRKDNYQNLQEYLDVLEKKIGDRQLKDRNFESLKILLQRYEGLTEEEILF